MIKVTFYGIDSMNRPIFVEQKGKKKYFYGDTDNLFSSTATEAEVLSSVKPSDLVYFGSRFDCEPMGTLPSEPISIQTK